MNHKIFTSHTREQVEQVALESGLNVVLSVSDKQQILRDAVMSFQRFSPEDEVFLVNARGLSNQNLSVFLKVLEDPNLRGSIWFYGKHLSNYPFTIRSRCETVLFEGKDEKDRVSDFLVNREVWAAKTHFEMCCLRGYTLDFAWEMLKKRDSFIEMLLMLDSTNDFALFASYLDKAVYEYVFLFVEWIQSNEIFTPAQSEVCSWLREKNALRVFKGLMPAVSIADVKHLFLSLLTYRLVYL